MSEDEVREFVAKMRATAHRMRLAGYGWSARQAEFAAKMVEYACAEFLDLCARGEIK